MASQQQQQQQEFDLMSLPFSQLNQIKKQMEEEISFLTEKYTQLRGALQKFTESKEALDTLQPKNEGKDVFVPMTSSMYVPGKLASVKTVIVDIGTGYFVEKNIDDAREFYKRKEKFLADNLQNLSSTINQKRKNQEILTEIMQAKLYDIQHQSKNNRQKAVATA